MFNGVATGVEQLIGIDADGGVGPTLDLVVPTRIGNTLTLTNVKTLIPVQWEIKNDHATDTLEIKFGRLEMQPAGAAMADTCNLLPGQAYTQQKRLAAQEYYGPLAATDLYYLRVRTAGGNVPFSGTLECWYMLDA